MGSSNASDTSGTPPQPAIPQDLATLGGSVFAFHDKLGANGRLFENGWIYQGPHGRMWTGVDTGDDMMTDMGGAFEATSTRRVLCIFHVGQFLHTAWTVSQAQAICRSFLPPDAQLMDTADVYDVSQSYLIGLEQHYFSASLANTLPAGVFKDVNGNLLTPGRFYIYYEFEFTPEMIRTLRRESITSQVDVCTLSTDETHKNPYKPD